MNGGLLFVAVLFILFYLLLIRPQRRRQRVQEQMLSDLRVGDEIVTAGGLYGEITRLDEDEVRAEIAPGLEVRIARRAVAGVFREVDEGEDEEEGEEEEAEHEPEEVEDEEPTEPETASAEPQGDPPEPEAASAEPKARKRRPRAASRANPPSDSG